LPETEGDRPLHPTEARLKRAREEGQTPLSREIINWTSLCAATVSISFIAPNLIHRFNNQLMVMVSELNAPVEIALWRAMMAFFLFSTPILITIVIVGCSSVLLQTGFLIRPFSTLLDISRVSPKRGLSRIISPDSAIELLKAVVKMAILMWAVWHAIVNALPRIVTGLDLVTLAAVTTISDLVTRLFAVILAAEFIIAAFDLVWTRFRFFGRLKMSLHDVKQENKEAEGDPVHRSRLKQVRIARARKRMMNAVPQATVIITNPTHYAVALAYDRGGKGAPKVVAKGMDDVAARIREVAEQHGIVIVPNPPLARALFTLPLDAEISVEHFKTVAEIIAYVWRLRAMTGRR